MAYPSISVLPRARRIEVVGAACGDGAADPRCAAAPRVLRGARLLPRLRAHGINAAWRGLLRPAQGPNVEPLQAVSQTCTLLARQARDIARRGALPLVLGGDHSCAIGTWKGVAHAHAGAGALGLLWIDAHMDAHTPATTPSGLLHGMPLACLLGHGAPALTTIGGPTRLDPRHVCLIGVRSFEAGEAALLQRLGVRVFYMHDIERDGLQAVMRQALAIAGAASAGFGVSLDLDAIDPCDAPATGIAVAGGIRGVALCGALSQIARNPALRGIEIVEYNPFLDRQGATAGLIAELIEAMLLGQHTLALETPLAA
ncbi:MAG: arginase [Betaproteobacteria bacterium]|nr:arginase [Betaproteobacteria bacterium]